MRVISTHMRHLVSVGVLVFGLALLAAGLAISPGSASRSATPEVPSGLGLTDYSLPDTPEDNAQYGNLFLGTVLREAGQVETPLSNDFSLVNYLYDVEVDQTLKGSASGVVLVYFHSIELFAPEDREAAKLHPGDRALFIAGYNPEDDWYPVSADQGVERVASDQQAAELVALYEPLIREAERNPRQPAAPDPCETPSSDPQVTLSETSGTVGNDFHLTGGPFARAEVAVSWDDSRDQTVGVPVGENCQEDGSVEVPDLTPGQHTLVVEDALGRTARIDFDVVGRK